MQQRRSIWFWIALFWLAALMSSNLYDERLAQSSTFLPGKIGNLVALLLLLWLSYFYARSHRWVAGALAALGLLAFAGAVRVAPVAAIAGVLDLGCAAGLLFAPFQRPGARPRARPKAQAQAQAPGTRYAARPERRPSPPRS